MGAVTTVHCEPSKCSVKVDSQFCWQPTIQMSVDEFPETALIPADGTEGSCTMFQVQPDAFAAVVDKPAAATAGKTRRNNVQ